MNARTIPTVAALVLTALLVGCAPESPSSTESGTPTPSSAPTPQTTDLDFDGPVKTPPTITMPTDCREIVSDSLLGLLEEYPLNDEAFAPNGVQPDGTLICAWGDPKADTTRLVTFITVMEREPAFALLNELIDEEDFSCYTPDFGTRCEKTWENEEYPVTDGRTLYWRDDVLIDTRYSNLAPPGYTADIVAHLFAAVPTPTPAPTPTPFATETPSA